MVLRQIFDTLELVRLQVERDPSTNEITNELVNPDGALGAWGWNSPVQGTNVAGNTSTSPAPSLSLIGVGAGTVLTTTHPIYLNAGQWIAARWLDMPSGTSCGYRARFQFYNASGGLLSSTTQSAFYQATSNVSRTYAAVQAPAGTSYARLRFDVYATSANDTPPLGATIRWTNTVVGVANTSAALSAAALAAAPTVRWVDVTADSTSIDVVRTGLDVSTLTPRIVSAALDMATSTTLRPGHRVLLEAKVSGTWQPIFTGRTGGGSTEYAPTALGVQTVNVPVAYDAASILARTPLPESSIDGADGRVGAFRATMERAVTPVPWLLNGNPNQSGAVLTTAATDTSATMLDQVIRARDSIQGSGWIDRRGVLVLRDKTQHDAAPVVDTITDADYNAGLVVGYDTTDAINVVTINNWSGTAAATYGPYRRNTSIRRWGELSATVTTFGLSGAQVDALAASILDANAEPTLTPSSVTIALATPDLVNRFALRDVGDRLQVTCTTPAINKTVRIKAITHRIQRDRWLVTYDLALDGRSAMPTTS